MKTTSNIKIFAYLFACSTILAACKSDDTNPTNPIPPLVYIDNFLENNQPEIQEFTIDASQGGDIEGKDGTKVSIPPNAFTDQSGQMVTGNVTFQLQEVYTAGGTVFAKRPTISNGNILVSGGNLFVNAQQDGEDLELANGQSIDFLSPTDSADNNMEFFVGSGEDLTFNWNRDTSTAMVPVTDTTGLTMYAYELRNMFNLINCDYFWNDPRPRTEVWISPPAGYDDNNTIIFIHIPTTSSVVPCYFWNDSMNRFEFRGGFELPVGLEVDIIGLHYDGVSLRYSVINTTIVNNHATSMLFKEGTPKEIRDILYNL